MRRSRRCDRLSQRLEVDELRPGRVRRFDFQILSAVVRNQDRVCIAVSRAGNIRRDDETRVRDLQEVAECVELDRQVVIRCLSASHLQKTPESEDLFS